MYCPWVYLLCTYGGGLRLSRARIAVVAAVAAFWASGVASPVAADSGPWVSSYGDAAKATVNSDRTTITVCDLDDRDDLRFKVEFATVNPIDPKIYTVVAPQGGCNDDRTYISRIKVFKLCIGRPSFGGIAWGDCHNPVWPRP